MKKWNLIAVAGLFILAGCQLAQVYKDPKREFVGFDPTIFRVPEPLAPNVFISKSEYIVVDQEPIRIGKDEIGKDGRVRISWALAAGSPHIFPKKGIEIGRGRTGDTPQDLRCPDPDAQDSRGKVFVCSFRAPDLKALDKRRFSYKYTVYVQGAGGKALEPLDPEIVGAY